VQGEPSTGGELGLGHSTLLAALSSTTPLSTTGVSVIVVSHAAAIAHGATATSAKRPHLNLRSIEGRIEL
jgi:hypothetical protein